MRAAMIVPKPTVPSIGNSPRPTPSRARARGVSGYARNLEQTRPRSRMRLRVDQGGFLELRVGCSRNCARGSGCASNQAYRFDVAPVRRRSSGVTVSVGAPLSPQVTRVTGAAGQSAGVGDDVSEVG